MFIGIAGILILGILVAMGLSKNKIVSVIGSSLYTAITVIVSVVFYGGLVLGVLAMILSWLGVL